MTDDDDDDDEDDDDNQGTTPGGVLLLASNLLEDTAVQAKHFLEWPPRNRITAFNDSTALKTKHVGRRNDEQHLEDDTILLRRPGN